MSPQFITNSPQAPLTNTQSGSECCPQVTLTDTGCLWGSGVLLNRNLVLTCRHVVNEKSVLTVRVNLGERFQAVSGKVLYSSAPSSPYDIAVVGLQESLLGLVTPRFAKHFYSGEDVVVVGYGALGASCGHWWRCGSFWHWGIVGYYHYFVYFQIGIVTSNTRDFTAKVTYPHLNFSIPVTVLEPLLRLFDQTGNTAVFKVLDSAEDDVRNTWRLQSIQSKL